MMKRFVLIFFNYFYDDDVWHSLILLNAFVVFHSSGKFLVSIGNCRCHWFIDFVSSMRKLRWVAAILNPIKFYICRHFLNQVIGFSVWVTRQCFQKFLSLLGCAVYLFFKQILLFKTNMFFTIISFSLCTGITNPSHAGSDAL